jgi:hypothetical protein
VGTLVASPTLILAYFDHGGLMKSRNRVYRTLADGYATLKSPLAEQYADAAEVLQRMAAEEEASPSDDSKKTLQATLMTVK